MNACHVIRMSLPCPLTNRICVPCMLYSVQKLNFFNNKAAPLLFLSLFLPLPLTLKINCVENIKS